jgi:hypothetical protein
VWSLELSAPCPKHFAGWSTGAVEMSGFRLAVRCSRKDSRQRIVREPASHSGNAGSQHCAHAQWRLDRGRHVVAGCAHVVAYPRTAPQLAFARRGLRDRVTLGPDAFLSSQRGSSTVPPDSSAGSRARARSGPEVEVRRRRAAALQAVESVWDGLIDDSQHIRAVARHSVVWTLAPPASAKR